MSAVAPCGTYAGYQRHRYHGEDACGPCKHANVAYQQDLRDRNPNVREANRRETRAAHAALRRLRDAHPDEYANLLGEERLRARTVA